MGEGPRRLGLRLVSPWLEQVLELRLRYIECFAPYYDPYDVVLDDFEAGMKTDEVRAIFAVLEPELASLVATHATEEEDDFLRGPFVIDSQIELSRELIERLGATWISFGSIRRCIPSRRRSAWATSASRRVTTKTTSTRCSQRCTNAATASTNGE